MTSFKCIVVAGTDDEGTSAISMKTIQYELDSDVIPTAVMMIFDATSPAVVMQASSPPLSYQSLNNNSSSLKKWW